MSPFIDEEMSIVLNQLPGNLSLKRDMMYFSDEEILVMSPSTDEEMSMMLNQLAGNP